MEGIPRRRVEGTCYAAMRLLGSTARNLRDGFHSIAPFMWPEEMENDGGGLVTTEPAGRQPVSVVAATPAERGLARREREEEVIRRVEDEERPERRRVEMEAMFKGIRFENKMDRVKAELLVKDVLSGQRETRAAALMHFNEISRPAATGILRALLRSQEDPVLLMETMDALSRLDEDRELEKAIFMSFLRRRDPGLRQAAVRAVSKYGDEEAFSILSSCLKDDDAGVRRLALDCLSWFYRDRCGALVISALRDPDEHVRKLAILICGSLRLPGPISPLITLLSDPSGEIQDSASASLRKITGQDFDFKSGSSRKRRDAAIEDWRFWSRNNLARLRV